MSEDCRMSKVRVEMHLTEEVVAKLDLLAAQSGRSRKNYCETTILELLEVSDMLANLPEPKHIPPSKREIVESVVANRQSVKDLTKSNVAVEPPKQATSNYAINSDGNEKSRKEQILAEIEAIKKEEKPSFVLKTDFERTQKKRLAKLEAELYGIK